MFHGDGRRDGQADTDRHEEAKFAFRKSVKAPKNVALCGNLQEVCKWRGTSSGLGAGG
jgi:hypothetical protein